MKHFGIIGYPLKHSFSAKLFSKKFADEDIDAEYSLYPIASIEDFVELTKRISFTGMNVTMPYKEAVIPFLDALDETAAAIGAVNVIRFTADGQKIGYNSDAIGFLESMRPLVRPYDKKALILGTGGAAKAVSYGLRKLGLDVSMVSRSADRGIRYEDLTKAMIAEHTVIVNATPLGMAPETGPKPPFPYEHLSSAHLLYDVIYNPEETAFLREGILRGCETQNGTNMLLGQAKAAWEIWNY